MKKEDNSTSTPDVFRPAKGSAKVVIGHGVQINGEIKKADEVQIDGEADVTMKTDNLVVGVTGIVKVILKHIMLMFGVNLMVILKPLGH